MVPYGIHPIPRIQFKSTIIEPNLEIDEAKECFRTSTPYNPKRRDS
ncbi:uncharacterized protein G2W53_015501 [Senna tora]|uniref:Uncharacterized protein n=1 Tax=Senna tora TaxID=362788 RepID=A0A834WV41_9FABA|nr:uncharacterized protein G2W53_015501 [Senna tora]